MSNRQSKPKLSSKELISKMKAKGITFIRMSENDAEKYLSMENNYLRAASYRKNYQKKKTRGNQEESYIKLDFGDLVFNCINTLNN